MTKKDLPLSLSGARVTVRRAVEKAEDLAQRGAFVLVDQGGIIVTASRMDGAGNLSFGAAYSKAAAASNHRYNSELLYNLYNTTPSFMIANVQRFSRTPVFPGPGAQIIVEDGRVIGAISTGLGVVPAVKFPGIDADKMTADGKPGNGEDICISYALRKPYAPQHGDDLPRWIEAYGKPPEGQGTGMADPPKAVKQVELDAAIRLCDAAIAEAERRNVAVSVAVMDRYGDMIQLDRMDYAAPMTPDIALAVGVTAVNFGAPSDSVANFPDMEGLARATPFKMLAIPGGLPIVRDGHVSGAIGVSGADPKECKAIAQAALGK